MRLTERDKAIISVVVRYRFLTTSLILSLIPGSPQNITRRLQRLYHAGFLDRPRAQLPLRYSGELTEFVYCPSRETDAGRGHRPVTSLFLAHALMVSEVLIRVEFECRAQGAEFIASNEILAANRQGLSVRRIQWRVMMKYGALNEYVGVIPDGAFAVNRGTLGVGCRRYYFMEVDRGTMPLNRKSMRVSSIRRKALAYLRSRRGCVLKDRFGIPGFQVIFIARSEERIAGMKGVCREATKIGDTSLFLFATLAEMRSQKSPLNFV